MKVLYIIMFLSLNACVTQMDGKYVSESFTAESLKHDKIAIAGVVSRYDNSMDKATIYSSLISREMKDEREFIKLLPQDYLVNQLGVSTRSSLMDSYLENTLTASSLTSLSANLSEARYLVFANVNENSTNKTTSETASRSYENDKGETVVTPAEVNKIHSRSMTVTINIYDLEDGQTVFTGSISKNDKNETTYEKSSFSNQKGLLGFVASVAETGIARSLPYPEAPSEIALISDIFEGFGENLPDE